MALDGDCEIFNTSEMLQKAQLLMLEMEEMLDQFSSTDLSVQSSSRTTAQDQLDAIEDQEDTLIVDGFRFESAASLEELPVLRSLPGGRQS